MANAETSDVESTPAIEDGKRKRPTKLIVGGVLLLALGAGGFAFFHMRSAKTTGATAAPAAKAEELFLPLDPAFVVNFQDDDATRFLQVGVTVMTRDAAAIQAIKDSDPVIRNALVMLFSSQTFQQLSTTAGKQKLQAEALVAVRKIVADKLGKPGVEALYFTSFVMQ